MEIVSQVFGMPKTYRATQRRNAALSFSRSSNQLAEVKR
jgi:hypothetical protein